MIDRIVDNARNGIAFVRKHPQLIMTGVLVVVIPIAFLVSGQQFLSAARSNQERLEMDRVGILHDTFASFARATDFNAERIQVEIEHIASLNPDITQFRVVREEGASMRVLASLDRGEVDTVDANSNAYRIANTDPDQSILVPHAESGTRYWEGYRLIQADGGDHYIFTEVSLARVDSLFAERVMHAYYWLFGILAIVLILVVRHVKLIDYAYLYHEVKRANEMRDLFTNMITHELRAPLTAMRGYASMIRERNDVPDEARTHASRVEESAERLVLIVNDLLDVARIQSGKLSMEPVSVNIQDVIASVIDAMQSSAREKGITVTRNGVRADMYITGDEKRLHQAFTNLISNAIKYTKKGTITVSVAEGRNFVEIRVQDTGVGISAQSQKNLFTPFYRVETAEVHQTIGTGLGMWITKQLIELMKGSIAVESIRGVGTHVVVTLPKGVPQ